jgi:O-antigen/teichoic acid export membrane protein
MFKINFFNAVNWSLYSTILKQILQIGSLFIYTKYLTPHDFGLFAMVSVFSSVAQLFNDFGIKSMIILHPAPSHELKSSIYFLNLLIGTVLSFVFFNSSNLIASFYNNNEIINIISLISFTFILSSSYNLHQALLEKKLNFKAIELIEIISIFISISIGIVCVIYELGVYSLALQLLSKQILSAILYWIFEKWRPSFIFSIYEIKLMSSHLKNLTVNNIIIAVGHKFDQLLIGKFLSSGSLGIYNMAFKLVAIPLQTTTTAILKVTFPALSKVQNDIERLKVIYLTALFLVSIIIMPMSIGLFVLSDLFVELFLGDSWNKVAPILSVMAISAMIQSVISTTGIIHLSIGLTSRMLKLTIFNICILMVSVLIGINYGIYGVAISYILGRFFLLAVNIHFSWRAISLEFLEGSREVIYILINSIVMGFVVYFSKIILLNNIESKFFIFILLIFISILSYLIGLKFKYKKLNSIVNRIKEI